MDEKQLKAKLRVLKKAKKYFAKQAVLEEAKRRDFTKRLNIREI